MACAEPHYHGPMTLPPRPTQRPAEQRAEPSADQSSTEPNPEPASKPTPKPARGSSRRRRPARPLTDVEQAEQSLRAEGFPLAVPPARRMRTLLAGIAPTCLWIAGTALLLTLGWAPLLQLNPDLLGPVEEPDLRETLALLLAMVTLVCAPIIMALAAWWLARWERRRALATCQTAGAVLWLVMVWSLSPGFGNLLGTSAPLLFPNWWGGLIFGAALLAAAYWGVGSMARWAVRQTVREMASLIPMVAKVLPLVMLAVLFLFVNAEIWKVADSLSLRQTFAVVGVLAGLAVLLLAASILEQTHRMLGTRRPEERERPTPQEQHDAARAAGGPWPRLAEGLSGGPEANAQDGEGTPDADRTPGAEPVSHVAAGEDVPLGRLEWLNFTLVPLLIQLIQAGLFSVLVFVFFVAFGSFAIPQDAAASWIGHRPAPFMWAEMSFPFSAVLVKVSLVIGVFAGLSFAASSTSDPAYRADFLDPVLGRLRRGVILRGIYRAFSGRSSIGT